MPQTPNHGYNVPNEGAQDWHVPLNDNFEQYDTDIEIRDTAANRSNYDPKQGAKFLATDTGRVSLGDGSNWQGQLAQSRYTAPSASGAAGNLVAGHANNSVGSGASAATIAGGGTSSNPNEATGVSSTVSGGSGNEASGDHATVAGGEGNSATAANAFAAGTNASADHEGAFIWSDTSSGGLSSLNENEFAVSAAGGVFFFSNSGATTGVELASGSGSWSSASSRALKSNVDRVQTGDVLDRVLDLDISTWNYDAEDEDVRHMGPMAEDFAAAFGLGDDEAKISTVDADGVAFAAIQGLAAALDDADETIERQQDRIDELQAENDALEARLAAVEEKLGLDGTADHAVTADD